MQRPHRPSRPLEEGALFIHQVRGPWDVPYLISPSRFLHGVKIPETLDGLPPGLLEMS